MALKEQRSGNGEKRFTKCAEIKIAERKFLLS